jgi:hypothetical protein
MMSGREGNRRGEPSLPAEDEQEEPERGELPAGRVCRSLIKARVRRAQAFQVYSVLTRSQAGPVLLWISAGSALNTSRIKDDR